MLKTTDLTERNYTRQQSIIINARYALSRSEIDIVLSLLTAIHKEDKDFKDYQFTIKDLEVKTQRAWNSKQLKDTIKSLMSKPLEFNKGNNSWEIVNWFSYFQYEEGLITCRFDKRLKPFLIDLSGRFVVGEIKHILPMKSSYSKRIYLLLKEYHKFGSRKFEVEELMSLLKVPKSLTGYGQFKQKVLERAEADINKFTDLTIKLIEKKQGRKIKWITFEIRKNEEDFKTFIRNIRECYPNEKLIKTTEGKFIKCSTKGFLYYADESMANLDKETALKMWHWMHENRKSLLCYKMDILEF